MVPEIVFDDGLHWSGGVNIPGVSFNALRTASAKVSNSVGSRIQDIALCSKPYRCPSNLKDKYLGSDILLAACGPPDERQPAFHSGAKGYHASKYNGS